MSKPEPIPVPITLAPGASLPEYATRGAAGMDVRSLVEVRLAPGERKLVRTGLRIAVPEGYEAQMRPRSGLALRHGIGMVNAPGTIDSDYRGELSVILVNHGAEPVRLGEGERIGQLVLCPVARAEWRVVQELDTTGRGEGGFGSTGRR
jgi:dUTP pyrophosphatase